MVLDWTKYVGVSGESGWRQRERKRERERYIYISRKVMSVNLLIL
jgi:hypothetical protein